MDKQRDYKDRLCEEMQPLIKRAEDENLLFEALTPIQDIVLTVKELKEHLLTTYQWSPDHWQLINPDEYRECLVRKSREALHKLKEFDKRLADSTPITEKGAIMLLGASGCSMEDFRTWLKSKKRCDNNTIYASDIEEFKKSKNGK